MHTDFHRKTRRETLDRKFKVNQGCELRWLSFRSRHGSFWCFFDYKKLCDLLTLRRLMSYIYIYIYDMSSLKVNNLTLILLTWRKW